MNTPRFILTSYLFLLSWLSWAQEATVKGRVFTEGGERIPGAYVQLTPNLATIADEAGRFAFKNLKSGKSFISRF